MTDDPSPGSAAPKRGDLYGYVCISAASVLFGVAGALAKVLFASTVSPVKLTALRAIIAAVVLVPVIAVRGAHELRVGRAQLRHLAIMAALLTAVNLTFYWSISETKVAIAIMLEYTAPVFVVGIGLLRGTHVLNRPTVGVLMAALGGCYLLTGAYDADILRADRLGLAAGCACGFFFALYNMFGNHGSSLGLSTTTTTFYTFAMSAAGWAIASPFLELGTVDYTASTVGYLLFIAVIATVLPYWLLVRGLEHINALPATIIGMLDPLVAGVVAFLVVDERLESLQLIGILVLLGTITYMKRIESALLVVARAEDQR